MINIYKLKWTRLQNEIFRFLCVNTGSKVNQREIARALKVSPTAIGKAIIDLKKDKILSSHKEPKINLSRIELNREENKVIRLKRAENLKMIYESGVLKFLEGEFPGRAIVLFGSYSKGEDTLKSDIDIAVIGSEMKNIKLESFEKILRKEINVNFYNSLKEIHKNLRENIFNGIVLSGRFEL